MNQKGEIVTIAVVATFVILSIATIAASTLTQNTKTALTTNTRASEYFGDCTQYPPVDAPANTKWVADCGRVCQSNNDCPKNTTDVNVFGDTSAWCYGGFKGGAKCMQLQSSVQGGGANGQADASCSIGKSCNVDACNDSKGGSSAKCPVCNGGWCAGGVCASCGKSAPVQKPTNPPPPTAAPQPTSAPQPTAVPQQPTSPPSTNTGGGTTGGGTTGGGSNTGGGTTGGGSQVQPTSPPVSTPITSSSCSAGYGYTDPGICKGECNGQVCTREGNKSCYKCPETTSPTEGTCSVRAYFKDSLSSENIKNVSFTFTPEKGSASSGTGSLTDYYSSGAQYGAGKVTITANADGYIGVSQIKTINPTTANSVCEVTIKMTKKNAIPPSFSCPSGESQDARCGNSCSSTQSCEVSTEEGNNVCYKCLDKPKAPAGGGTGSGTANSPTPTQAPANEGKLGGRCHSQTIPQSSGQQKYSCDEGVCDKSSVTCKKFVKALVITNKSPASNFIVENVCFMKGLFGSCAASDKTDHTVGKGGQRLIYDQDINKLCNQYYPSDENATVNVEIYFHRDPNTAAGLTTDTKSLSQTTKCKDFTQNLNIEIQ